MVIRRAARAAAFAAACAATLLAAPTAAVAAGGAPTGTPALRLLDQPVAVAPDGDFTVLVEAVDAPTATDIAIDIYDKVAPGEAIGPEPDRDPEATFNVVPVSSPTADGRRVAGFTIDLRTEGQPSAGPWSYRIDEPGVYPVRIRLRDGDQEELATLMTAIVRLPEPDEATQATRAALLVDVHRPPPTDPRQRDAADQADPSLLRELAPVLAALSTHPGLPATFSVTPDTLARIAGDPDAAETLASLRNELEADGRTLLDAPYVDVDATSLVGADLGGELAHQRELGRQTLRELLTTPSAGTWRLQDRVDGPTLDALQAAGVDRLLLPDGAIRGVGATAGAVDLPTSSGTIRAASVSDDLTLGAAAPDDPVLAAHRLLARLAQASIDNATSAVAPASAVVTIDPAQADEASLRIVSDALALGTPLFAAAPLATVLDQGAAGTASPASTTPAALGPYPATLRSSRSALTSYESMVAGATELVAPYERTLALSAARDLDLAQRKDDAASVGADLQTPFTSITIPAQDKVTLGARDASFPLPIESSLDHPVKVVIELESNDRLAFPQNRIEATLQPGRQVIPIKVRTRATGDTPVRITVHSPDDGVTLAESQYTIRSTAVSGVGVVLTVGAAGYLALWWGRHWRRNRDEARHARRRRRRRAEV
ncbi:MAG: DUF6049 family protein [Acidimicrobiales bacterium]